MQAKRLTQARKAAESDRDTNRKTAQMVQLISEMGPDIPEISRKLGQFKESVRYRYKEKILKRGFAIQAIPDYEGLGMRRVLIVVSFAGGFQSYAQTILTAMSELCYVTSFSGTFPEGKYVVNASVPGEFLGQFVDFIGSLRKKGLFSEAETFIFDLFRNVPMQAQYYDFDRGIWDFDWKVSEAGYVPEAKPTSKSFDKVDLLILKELQKDATQSLTAVASNLHIDYKKLAWHYNTHVIARGLIETYRLNWMGTRYDFKLEKALHRKHRYLLVTLLAKDIGEGETLRVMHGLNKLPFVWSWAAGRSYYTQIALPVDLVNEGLQFIGDMVAPVRDRVEYFLIDQSNSLAFSICYKLFDEKGRRWTFNPQDLLLRFADLMVKIRESAGQPRGTVPTS